MKIAIDVSQIVYGTGVSNYVKNLVVNLLAIDNRNQYCLFGGTLREQKKLVRFYQQLKGDNFETKIISNFSANWGLIFRACLVWAAILASSL